MATKTIEIPFNGLGNNPSDYDCKDGQLALAVNVLHENSSLHPFHESAPKVLNTMISDQKVIYQHKNDDYTHFIYKDSDGSYRWYSKDIDPFVPANSNSETSLTTTATTAATASKIPSAEDYEVVHFNLFSITASLQYATATSNDWIDVTDNLIKDNTTKLVKLSWTLAEHFSETPPIPKRLVIESYQDDTLIGTIDTDAMPNQSGKLAIELGYLTQRVISENSTILYKVKAYMNDYDTCEAFANYTYKPSAEEGEKGETVDTTKYESNIADYYGIFSDIPLNSVTNVISVGNTIIFYSADNTYYYLWNSDGVYKFLGNHIPELQMSFGLTPYTYLASSYGSSSSSRVRLDGVKIQTEFNYLGNNGESDDEQDPDTEAYIQDDDVTAISDAVIGLANKFNNEWCNEKGYFSQPFLIRYAYRMYDEKLTMHSAPILLVPSTGTNPFVFIRTLSKSFITIDLMGIGAELRYSIKQNVLEDWKDIIKSVDIFVSQPFYTYKAGDKCRTIYRTRSTTDEVFVTDEFKGNAFTQLFNSISISNINGNGDELDDEWDVYNKKMTNIKFSSAPTVISIGENSAIVDGDGNKLGYLKASYQCYYVIEKGDEGYATCPLASIPLPEKSKDAINEEIENCSNFYLIKSIKVNKLMDTETLDLSTAGLSNLVTNEAMEDEYESHHTLIPTGVASYNNRLNTFNVKKEYFEGFKPYSAFQRVCSNSSPTSSYAIRIFVYIKDRTKEMVVEATDDSLFDYNYTFPYFYYPDPNAYKVGIYRRIYIQSNSELIPEITYAEFELTEHKGLNGAVAFIGFDSFSQTRAFWTKTTTLPSVTTDNSVALKSYVYTSETDNPFVFKAANVEQVGAGTVIAMAPTTLPLSQGQYGWAEMYCFTTDGIWALSVSDTGGWKAKQPFHYDGILNDDADNILRMERDILFSTTRGLMELSANKIDCISENFDGNLDKILGTTAWLQQFNKNGKVFIKDKVLPLVWGNNSEYNSIDMYTEFKKFIGDAVMLYDYPHQRVIIGNPNYTFCYVYSLKDSMWTSIPVQLINSVNSYPECYAMIYDIVDGKNKLVDFSSDEGVYTETSNPYNGLIITRPFKLNTPSVQKTIRTINLQGQFDKTHTGMILLGCNDNNMKDWFVVSSCEGSRLPFRYGTPFKAFRLIVVSKLAEGESLSQMTIEYEYKELNKERQ